MAEVFPHLRHLELPKLTTIDEIDFAGIDLAFAALPHGITSGIIKAIPKRI